MPSKAGECQSAVGKREDRSAGSLPREEEYATKSKRLEELNIELNLDKQKNEIVDGEQEEMSQSQDKAERAFPER